MGEELKEETAKELWGRAKTIYLSTIQSVETKSEAERYLALISKISCEGNTLVISTAAQIAADKINSNYSDKLRSCLDLAGADKSLQLVIRYDPETKNEIVIPTETVAPKKSTASAESAERKVSTFVSTLPLNDFYTFDEFVRGPSNSFAWSAAQAAVKNPGMPGCNPLFIHGGTGLGKTHLMQAIGNELKKNNPEMAICYLTAETFMTEYVSYMKNHELHLFREKYRSVDVLLIDDIQFFQNKGEIQEEFFNTFNSLQNRKKQIVMTSDVAPKNLPSVEGRLISRFEGGMVQEIDAPSYETRLAIISRKNDSYNLHIPMIALEFIAANIKSHVRAMEGALNKIGVFMSAYPGEVITKETLVEQLKDFIQREQARTMLSVEEIQMAVGKFFNVSVSQILSVERTASIVTPRQISMYISRKLTTKSLEDIAKVFNRRHATIIHGVKTIEDRLKNEIELKRQLEEIITSLGYKITDAMD